MKKACVTLLLLGLLLISVTPATTPIKAANSPFDPAKYNVPNTIAGHKVLAVISSDNTKCTPPGHLILLVRVSAPDAHSYLGSSEAQEIHNALTNLGNPHWTVRAIGPDASLDNLETSTNEWNNNMNGGCLTLAPANTGSNLDVIPFPNQPGRGLFEAVDAGVIQNDTALTARLIAPKVGDKQDPVGFNGPLPGYSGLLLNAQTDTGHFMQVGFLFMNGIGQTVYTSTNFVGFGAQLWDDIPYVVGDVYYVSISGTGGAWGWCMGDDAVPSTYRCQGDINGGSGTQIVMYPNSSVWFENYNTQPGWYRGFSNPVKAWSATICPNGLCQGWSSEHRHLTVASNCSQSYINSLSTTKAVKGTMLQGAIGSFDLRYIPLRCP